MPLPKRRPDKKENPENNPTEENVPSGYARDEKTGKLYKILPKTKFIGKGKDAKPILEVPDFDSDNLELEAEKFLPHLRVPPDRKEMERLRAEKAKQRREQNARYKQENNLR